MFLSLKCFTIFLFMELLIWRWKTFLLEMGESHVGKSTYAMRGWGDS